MARLILDSGAVIALAGRDPRAREVLARAVRAGSLVSIPAPVLVETTRGTPKDAPVNRVVAAVNEVASVTEETAREAGRLLGRAGVAATVDALVAAEAVRAAPAVILTGDVADLSALTARHPRVRVHAI